MIEANQGNEVKKDVSDREDQLFNTRSFQGVRIVY